MELHPSMAEIYNLVLHDAPYVVAAYAIIWLGLVGYIVALMFRTTKLEKEVQTLQEAVDAKLGKSDSAGAKPAESKK
ncbi:MAG: CcmD family protein [Coriobacteriia bacterium]|nr:CcmD family protein [Coriobacteriia bacterium]MCL2746394.1 CcmD family protein [Coriobacteriia bacterium]MCL2870935.1 CcmD family protein [Coriobacteriia bacterium]